MLEPYQLNFLLPILYHGKMKYERVLAPGISYVIYYSSYKAMTLPGKNTLTCHYQCQRKILF
jgi:hypothetical protein